ncbi:MAG: dimeric dUTPase (all-alpha-NTP-PPase superfamily) [Lentisphaeria bacterium]|jgi:dimeric dUTPase (all-alpha-NTP-PPase superfamily)
MKQKILTMLEMQDAMNTRVHPQWKEQDFEWYRAIWVECAELMDHYGWKWWKKQAPDMEQVILELIDIWHFGLSIYLSSAKALPELVGDIEQALDLNAKTTCFKDDLETFALSTLSSKSFDIPTFSRLMLGAGLDFDELYRQYVGKNVLNFFRQDNGYNDGSYRKIWSGKEDNEHLVEVVAELDVGHANYRQQLYQALLQRYRASS